MLSMVLTMTRWLFLKKINVMQVCSPDWQSIEFDIEEVNVDEDHEDDSDHDCVCIEVFIIGITVIGHYV